MEEKFKGKSIVITGGANGIGEGIALAFGKLGAIVFIADMNEQKGNIVVNKIEKNGGRIINMASTRAIMSEPNSEAYAASKGGIVSITHSLAASLQPNGITVNCISPGWIQVDQSEELKETDHLQHWSNRVGKPEDIAKACIYLADPENNFINGQNIIIDGGMTRKMIYEE